MEGQDQAILLGEGVKDLPGSGNKYPFETWGFSQQQWCFDEDIMEDVANNMKLAVSESWTKFCF